MNYQEKIFLLIFIFTKAIMVFMLFVWEDIFQMKKHTIEEIMQKTTSNPMHIFVFQYYGEITCMNINKAEVTVFALPAMTLHSKLLPVGTKASSDRNFMV